MCYFYVVSEHIYAQQWTDPDNEVVYMKHVLSACHHVYKSLHVDVPPLMISRPCLTLLSSQSKARLRKSGLHTPSPPLSPQMAEREEPGEEGAESGMTEQQQAAMQQEERVLTQQIENLQKEKLV